VQRLRLQELLDAGAAQMNAARIARLRSELELIEDADEALGVLVENALKDERVAKRIDQHVQEQVDARIGERTQLQREIETLRARQQALTEKIAKQEKEQRALAPSVSKSIKNAFAKARGEAIETLGQVAVFKALMERTGDLNVGQEGQSTSQIAQTAPAIIRPARRSDSILPDVLRALGILPRHARAIEVAGELALKVGLILVIEGTASRIAVEKWVGSVGRDGLILDCEYGMTSDHGVRALIAGSADTVALLDANVSALELIARPLIEAAQYRLAGLAQVQTSPRILMSFTDGVTGLPAPMSLEAVSLKLSLDQEFSDIDQNAVLAQLEDAIDGENRPEWLARFWRPAGQRIVAALKELSTDDAALVISMLKPS
jgi:hypothetical protein